MGKHTSPPATGTDVQAALEAFGSDLLLDASQTIRPLPDGRLEVYTRVWRTVGGERVGICHETREWGQRETPLLSFLLGCLHRMYWRASDMATSEAPTSPMGQRRVR